MHRYSVEVRVPKPGEQVLSEDGQVIRWTNLNDHWRLRKQPVIIDPERSPLSGSFCDNRYVVTNVAFKPGDELAHVVASDSTATPTAAGWVPTFQFAVPVEWAPHIGEAIIMSWGQRNGER